MFAYNSRTDINPIEKKRKCLHIYRNLIYDHKSYTSQISRKRMTNLVDSLPRKASLIPYRKVNSRKIKDLKLKGKTIRNRE